MDKGKPVIFAVSTSGKHSASFYCPSKYVQKYGGCGAISRHIGPIQRDCKKYAKKKGSKERCYIFAKGYKIVWNSVNYKLPRDATPAVIEKVLRELGFYGQQASKKIEKKETKKKIEKKKKPKKKMNGDIVQQLKDLEELYESGVLTKEEFTKAKKKLLN